MDLKAYLKIKKHNDFIERELLRAANGDIINLTDLLIQKEKIIININD